MRTLSMTERDVAWTGRAARACLLLLIGLCLAWEWWLAPTGQRTLVVKVLPLACAVPGLWRRRLYTHRWLSLLAWAYVAEGAVRAASDHGVSRGLAAGEAVLAASLCTACGLQVRSRLALGRWQRRAGGVRV